MLEASRHEAGDGRDDGHDLVNRAASAIAHPDSHADQGIAHDPQSHSLDEGQGSLTFGNIQGSQPDGATTEGILFAQRNRPVRMRTKRPTT